ncbi:hypothetical protein B296_00002585 [Ensete ventricosum]|uniref:Uncharacterized protein n=1 Tax=Ensete ventricosum TaxID=4639 RepID=A0A426ZJG9_ENSVE|nr:hypothetical protein B296_00002585 [Ensete ventricosum]
MPRIRIKRLNNTLTYAFYTLVTVVAYVSRPSLSPLAPTTKAVAVIGTPSPCTCRSGPTSRGSIGSMRNYHLARSLSLTLTFGHPRRLIPIEPPSSALAHQAPELVFIPMAFLSPPCSDLPNRKRRPPSIVDLDDLKFGRPVMSGFPSSVGNGTTKKRTLRRSFGGARWGPMWSNSLVSSLMRIARMYIQPNALAETESDILYNRERSYLSVRSDGAICASFG